MQVVHVYLYVIFSLISSILKSPLSIKLEDVLPYSDSDDDYDDVEYDPNVIVSETLNRQRTESDVIDIIGSLCLEGVFQGLSEDGIHPQSKLLPDSIRMTDNLVKRENELDELSVLVTRNIEIVPETPFDANASSKKSFGGILRTKKKGSSGVLRNIIYTVESLYCGHHCNCGHHCPYIIIYI